MHALQTYVKFGGPVKVLETKGDLVTIGSEAVLYDDPERPVKDLTDDFFTVKSYLGATRGDGVDATVHHGFPLDTKNAFSVELSEHVFSHPWKTEDTEQALLASLVLDMRDKYEKWVYENHKNMRLSTGAVGHLVKREPSGWLRRWPIGEIALTPTPAEPRLGAMTLKSFLGLRETKAENLSGRMERIYSSFGHRTDWAGWVAEIWDEYVIAHLAGDYYRVPYQATGSGWDTEVAFADFSEWVRVEKPNEWQVAKAVNDAIVAHIDQTPSTKSIEDLAREIQLQNLQFALTR